MTTETIQMGRNLVLVCEEAGAPLAGEADAIDIIGATWGQEIDWVAIPVGRLAAAFLDLKTGVAGAVIQKFVTYRLRLAIVGDIASALASSKALQDFVRESNAGAAVWFVPDLEALERRLGR